MREPMRSNVLLAAGSGIMACRLYGRFRLRGVRWWMLSLTLSQLLAVVILDHARYIRPRLAIRRHTFVLLNPLWPGIVSCERLDHVVVVEQQQLAKVANSAIDVIGGVEPVLHA